MKYLMLVCTDAEPETDDTAIPDIDVWVEENDTAGRRVIGMELVSPAMAKTVRVRNGETLVSDGPFAETKELIVGFDLLECSSLAQAIEVARAHPMAHHGRIEIRQAADAGV